MDLPTTSTGSTTTQSPSKGHLGITLFQASLTDEDSVFNKPMTREELQNNPGFVGNSMFDTAAWLIQMHELEVPDIDLIEAIGNHCWQQH